MNVGRAVVGSAFDVVNLTACHHSCGGSGSTNIGTSTARGYIDVANTIVGGSTIAHVVWANLDTLDADVKISTSRGRKATTPPPTKSIHFIRRQPVAH